MSCVNKSSKEFKQLVHDNNVSSNTLELIVHKYWLETGSEENFPTNVFIQAQLGNGQYKESISAVRDLWQRDYQQPHSFSFLQEVKQAYDKALSFFPAEEVFYYKNAQDGYTLAVKQPVSEPITSAKEFFGEGVSTRKLNLGLQEGVSQSVDKVQELYNLFNTDRTTRSLADKVFGIAKQLDIQVTFDESLPGTTIGRYTNNNSIIYRKSFFENSANASIKAPILLHEMLHAISMYVLSDQTSDWYRSAPVEKFRKEVNDIFSRVKYNASLEGEKGTQNVSEFVAELSNPIFRQKLQSIDSRKWYTKILDAFKSLLGIHSFSTYYNRMMKALDGALEAFDFNSYMEYNGMKAQLQQAYNEHLTNPESMPEAELKTTLKDAIKENKLRSDNKENNDGTDRLSLHQRFSQEEYRGCSGTLKEAEALLQRGSYSSTPEKSGEVTGVTWEGKQAVIADKQIAALENWAKKKKIWIDNTTKHLKSQYGNIYAEGGEAQVYLFPDGTKVIKEIRLDYFVEPQLLLDRIVLHNYLFPKTGLTITDFGKNNDGKFVVIAEQPFVQGEYATPEEIKEYMTSMGFEPYNSKGTEFINKEKGILVNDLHTENVIKFPDGYAVINADIRLNTANYKLGGTRTTDGSNAALDSFIDAMSKDQLTSQLKQIKQEYADYELINKTQEKKEEPTVKDSPKQISNTQQVVAKQLIHHMKSMGLQVKSSTDMQKFFAEHPNTLLQESIFGIDASYLNQKHLDVIPDIQKVIESRKYNKAGTTLVKLEDSNNIYLVDHSNHEEYKNHRKEGRHGVGIRKVYDLTKLTTEDAKEIIRNIAAGHKYSANSIRGMLQGVGINERHFSELSLDAELKAIISSNASVHTATRGQRSTEGYGQRGYNNTDSKQSSRIQRTLRQGDEQQLFLTPKGEVYGFVDKEGNIYLDETKISPEHPIHEYTHLWDRALAKFNPELWQSGINLMKQLDLWGEVLNDFSYGKLWQDKGITGDRLTNLVASEVHSRLVGKEGAKTLEDLAKKKGNAGIIDKLKQWLLKVWRGLKETFSHWNTADLDSLTLDDFNRMTVRDFTKGINPLTSKTTELPNYGAFNNMDSNITVDFAWKIPLLQELDAELSNPDNTQEENKELINRMNDILKAATEDDIKEISSTKQKEIQQDLDEYDKLNTQFDRLLSGEFADDGEIPGETLEGTFDTKFTSSELQHVTELVGDLFSNLITRIQSEDGVVKELFPLLSFKGEVDFTKMSRTEVVEKIGIQNLVNKLKSCFEPASPDFIAEDDGYNVPKAFLLQENWDAVMLKAASTIAFNEGFSIKRDYKHSTFDINKEQTPIAYDDFNNPQDEDSIREMEGDEQEHWQVEARTIDTLNSMSTLVKQALHNCYILDKEGNKVMDKDWNRLPLRVDPRNATNSILRWTQGALSLEDMIAKLQAKQPDNPWVSQLIERLSDKTGKETDFQSQFFSAFEKHFQLYNVVQMSDGKYVSLPVNSHPALSEAVASINGQIKMGEHPLFYSNGKIKTEILGNKNTVGDNAPFNLHQALYHLEHMTEKGLTYLDRKDYMGNLLYYNEDVAKEAAKWLSGVFKVIGYPVTEEMILNVATPYVIKMMGARLEFIIRDLTKELELQKGKANSTINYDPMAYFGRNNIGGTIRNLLMPITDSLEDTAISAFYDSGNMYQSYAIPSFMTKLMQNLKSSNRYKYIEKMYGDSEWFRNPETKEWRLDILKQLPGNFDFKVELNFNKHNYMRNMSDAEYTLSLITEFFADGWNTSGKGEDTAWYAMPMQSNKPSSEFLRLFAYRDTTEGKYKNDITDKLYKMFLQELSRIQTVNMRNLNPKTDCEAIKNFDTNGRKFCFLPFLNGYLKEGKTANRHLLRNEDNTVSKDNDKLASLLQRKLEGLEESQLSAEEEATLAALIKKAIKNYMETRVAEVMNAWENSGMVEAARDVKNIVWEEHELNKNLKKDNPERNKYVKQSLEMFLWNDYLAKKQILQLTVGDIAFYKDMEDLQKRLAQLHAPGNRGNIFATDYGKYDKNGKQIEAGKRVSDGKYRTLVLTDWNNFQSNIIDNISEVFDRKIAAASESQKAQMQALKESLVGKEGAYRRINVADAQGFSSPSSYRKKALIFGKWSQHYEDIYQNLLKDNYNYTDLQTAFQPLKPFVYTLLDKNMGVPGAPITKMKVPFQAKNSEYLLIMADAILKEDEAAGNKTSKPNLLKAIYRVMEDSEKLNPTKGIDTVQFESAIKSGLQGRINLHQFANLPGGEEAAYTFLIENIYKKDANGNRTSEYNTDTFIHETSFEDYCLQQEVPEHFRNHFQAHGSQERMIIPSDLDFYVDEKADHDDPNNINYYEWTEPDGTKRKVNAKEFRQEYEETIAQSIAEDITSLQQELHLDAMDKKERNIALSKILQREILSSPRYGVDLLQACSVDKNTGEFRMPKGDPIQSKRIEQLLNSIIKNRINKQKIAGGPIVQVSNYGTSKQLNIRFKNKQNGLLKSRAEFETNPVKGYESYDAYIKENQAGVAYFEVFTPIWSKELFEKFADEQGNIDMVAVENACPELLNMVSYRIPTEDKYSIAPMKVVGFLPREAGDAIMLPYDLTTIDDSDFDVDKRYVMRKVGTIKKKQTSEIFKTMFDIVFQTYAKQHDGKVNKQYLKDQLHMFLDNPEKMKNMDALMRYFNSIYRRIAYITELPTSGREYRDNKIIDMTLAVLTNERSTDKLLNPGGFEDVAKMGYQIAAFKSPQATEQNLSWEQLSEMSEDELKDVSYTAKDIAWTDTQVQFYKQNAATSSMIGIFAISKIAHAILESNGIFLDVDSLVEPFTIAGMEFSGRIEIDPKFDREGNLIGKTAGSLVSASADGVKKPVLDLMNISPSTAGVLNSMLRLGMPFKQAAMFMSQDVITRLLKEFNNRNLTNYASLSSLINEFLTAFEKANNISDGSTIKSEELSESELIEGLKPAKHSTIDYKVLLALSKLLKINNEMKHPTFATRFNSISAAVGPLITDNLMIEYKMQEFGFGSRGMYETHFSNREGDAIDIEEVLDMHPVLREFSKAVSIAANLFNDMPAGSNSFRTVLEGIPEDLQNKVFSDRKLLTQFSDFFQSYLLTASGLIDSSQLKYFIEEFPKEFIKNTYKEKYSNNKLIQAILPRAQKKGNRTTLEIKTTGMDTRQKEELSSAWTDLHKEDPELSKKLFIYNFFRTGMGFSPKTFMSLAPLYVKENLSNGGVTYIDTFRNLPTVDKDVVIDQFVRNNWSNNKLVPWKGGKGTHYTYNYEHGYVEITNKEDIANLGNAIYFKTKSGNRSYLWRFSKGLSNDFKKTYELIKPLGNNGEYLEISKDHIKQPLDTTTETAVDNAPTELREQSITEEEAMDTPTVSTRQEEQAITQFLKYLEMQNPVLKGEKGIERYEELKRNPKNAAKFLVNVFKHAGLNLNPDEAMKEFKKYC